MEESSNLFTWVQVVVDLRASEIQEEVATVVVVVYREGVKNLNFGKI